jgi:predicted SPOUT superfamily RNA methylase MTH1
VDNCQTKELKTCLVGQIARAAAIYHVDEIVVFNDHLGGGSTNDSCKFMAKILQYCECPQYLRKHFFPMDPDLQYVGVLSPLDAPHHVRANERCKYGGSCVNVGIGEKTKTVEFMDKLVLKAGIRCTVKMFDTAENSNNATTSKVYDNRHIQVKVVSPKAPTLDDGTYWGYTVRLANSIQQVFDDCPYEDGTYDLKVGTSERGDDVTDVLNNDKKKLPRFQHMIMVFGGIAGIEEVRTRCLSNYYT